MGETPPDDGPLHVSQVVTCPHWTWGWPDLGDYHLNYGALFWDCKNYCVPQ